LPDLAGWPGQLARWANRSYDFRGVEVTVAGDVHERDGSLWLAGPALPRPVELVPFRPDVKLQWDHQARRPREATRDELNAYETLRKQGLASGAKPVRVTGPLAKSGEEWRLHVREFV
jgi:hypothetical protein